MIIQYLELIIQNEAEKLIEKGKRKHQNRVVRGGCAENQSLELLQLFYSIKKETARKILRTFKEMKRSSFSPQHFSVFCF